MIIKPFGQIISKENGQSFKKGNIYMFYYVVKMLIRLTF